MGSNHGDKFLQAWHERLAHLNFKEVKPVLSNEGIRVAEPLNKSFYKSCVLGKFLVSERRARRVGELIHADLCCPMEESSIGTSKYFLFFKDDYYKYRKVYFFRNKSDAPEFFKKYRMSMENETEKKIQKLRTDNGLEFINWKLKEKTDNLSI